MELFEHQKSGIAFLKEKKRAILADSMGLGKTRQAIIAAGETSDNAVLVVCPASLKINWEREIHAVYPEDQVGIVVGGANNPQDHLCNAGWIIINYDILEKHREWLVAFARARTIETLILDEAHYAKDTRAIRTKAALAIALPMKQVYLLTGTPVMNRPIELFALLRAVQHPLAYNTEKAMSTLRKDYGKRYCAAYFHRLGFTGRGFWDETGASRLPELRELTKNVILRRTKDEVLDLPPKIVSVVPCVLNENDQKSYDQAWDNYLQWVANHPDEVDIGNVLSAQAMIELGKLKQVCSLSKAYRIADDIENAVAQEQKVIVFTQYTATVNRIKEEMGNRRIGFATLTGENDSEERQQAVDSFQKDPETKVFIANMKAGGVGITLTAASIVIFADMDWSPAIHQQAEDRAHRIGQAGTVNVYYYVADGTIEEDIIDILTAKQETIGVLTGGETTIKPFMNRLLKRINER